MAKLVGPENLDDLGIKSVGTHTLVPCNKYIVNQQSEKDAVTEMSAELINILEKYAKIFNKRLSYSFSPFASWEKLKKKNKIFRSFHFYGLCYQFVLAFRQILIVEEPQH